MLDVDRLHRAAGGAVKALALIERDRLHELWEWVRQGLIEVRARAKAEWLPEDVYAELRAGTAHLCVVGAEDGFCVLQRKMEFSGPVLFVWVLHGDCAQHRCELEGDLTEIAHAMGARRIVMHSSRKGWERMGFTARTTVYEKAV